MNIELIAIDLDGTLVNDGEIDTEDKKAVNRVIDEGIPMIPATTRLRASTIDLIDGLPMTGYPIICNNGARVLGPGWHDESKIDEWRCTNLDLDLAKTVSRYADEKGYELSTVFRERVYWKRREKQKVGKHPEIEIGRMVENNRDAVNNGSPINFMMHRDRNGVDGLNDVEKFIKDEFTGRIKLDRHHYFDEWRAISIYDSSVSKFNALKLVCDRLNIDIENVMAIGNDEVDRDMIENAGVGVAMENSPEYIKNIADHVAPSCRDNGIKWILEELL